MNSILQRWRLVILVALVAVAMQLLVVATSAAAEVLPPGVPIWIGPLLLGAIQYVVAFALKKNPKVVNGVIGWVTLILSVVGYSVVPKEANAANAIGASLGAVKGLGLALAAVLQTAIVTGVHEWFLGSVIKPITGRSTKSTDYLPPR